MQFATNTNGIVGTFMIFWALMMLAFSVCLLLLILSIWHIIKHPDIQNRWLWLALVLILPIVGSAIYFMAVLVPYNRAHPYVPDPSKQN